MTPIQLGLAFAGLLGAVFFLSDFKIEAPSLPKGSMASMDTGARRDTTNPADLIRTDFYGDRVTSPGVAGQGRDVHLISALLDGGGPRASERPAALVAQPAVAGCAPRRPAEDEVIVSVQAAEGGIEAPLWLTSAEDLARETRYWVGQKAIRSAFAGTVPDKPMQAARRIDVILTETEGPVYLVLQTVDPRTVWHVVAAPGVRLAHVAAVGPAGIGVSLPAPAAPVEFVQDCAPRPAREPARHWDLFSRIGSDPSHEAKARGWFADYDRWFRGAFGIGVEAVTVGGFAADHVLAGPVPAEPVAYRPFQGASVIHGPVDHAFAGSEPEARHHFGTLQAALAAAAAGGSLEMIVPPVMERVAALPGAEAETQP